MPCLKNDSVGDPIPSDQTAKYAKYAEVKDPGVMGYSPVD